MNKKIPTIKVVFDTNVLFTKFNNKLFNKEISALIKRESEREDVDLSWYLPEVVVMERQHQMMRGAFELLPAVSKLNDLLGSSQVVNEDIIKNKIDEHINNQIISHKIQVLNLNTSDVDWKNLIDRACFRLAPFSADEEEKGFRDSIIAQIFLQLVDSTQKADVDCKLFFMTNDGELKKYIEEKIKNTSNVTVLINTQSLIGHVNALTTHISEKTLKNYIQLSNKYFFEKGNPTSFYYVMNLRDQIIRKYENAKLRSVEQGLLRENRIWQIYPPQFIKKEKTRIYWSTRISIPFILYKWEPTYITANGISTTSSLLSPFQIESRAIHTPVTPKIPTSVTQNNSFPSDLLPTTGLFGAIPAGVNLPFSNSLSSLEAQNTRQDEPIYSFTGEPLNGLLSGSVTKKIISQGQSAFDIEWSVNIGPHDKVSDPQLHEIVYLNIE
ncbi:PIN domain-containing protein [Legionella waltersii]|uniref:DUF4935 domain-containing protein n=1 Tax=Legionella waltersii TaxID=66969 RepID=A0A0W1ANV1_9GAMM|nr:PIN domain-containing protein [Legionella waltersii]KTD82989.1 hypothetical protein Lwal_0105 [Legionella waltersii]SNV07501.1 Uncharacterised protein [Legionella waltersii]HAU3628224.1 hypothetical protein [Legionella pneumophila]HAU3648726.1 hypothetical protein [Legionella pneumophila]